jgi:hypothetical protein
MNHTAACGTVSHLYRESPTQCRCLGALLPTPSTDDAFVRGLQDGGEAYESGIIPAVPELYRSTREVHAAYLAGYGAEWRASRAADEIREEARNG